MASTHSNSSDAQPAGQPSPLIRLGWWALLAYFPLLQWILARLLPPGGGPILLALRVTLFHGGGTLWSYLLLRWEGRLPAIKQFAARPGAGLRHGVYGFVAIAGLATLLLRLPSGILPPWLPGLLHPLDLSPVPADPRLPMDPGALLRLVLLMVGGAMEEWIFRCVLWLRWAGALSFQSQSFQPLSVQPLSVQPQSVQQPPVQSSSAEPLASQPPPAQPLPSGEVKPSPMTMGYEFKLTMLSVYFAWLHWPQGPMAMLLAFLGSLVLGGVLWWRRSFWLIATLHALYNWNSL